MQYDPPSFAGLLLGDFRRTALTPREPRVTTGEILNGGVIRVVAPQRIALKKDERVVLPICGYAMIPVNAPGPFELFVREHATDLVTSGAALASEEVPRDEPRSRPPDPGVTRLGEVCFNMDAADRCRVPDRPGTFSLWAERAGLRSNEVEVVVVREE